MPTFVEVANELRFDLTQTQVLAFETYTRRLLVESRRTGLTALRDRESIERRGFAESLALLRFLEERDAFASPAIDIGTGAGFPGLPIKIARPGLDLTLLEATGKKARFLTGLVTELGLVDVSILQGRAEDAAREPRLRGAFRLALARAVAPLATLAELALPFLAIGGFLVTPKGSRAALEVREASAALRECGGEIVATAPLPLQMAGPVPTVVLMRKVAETPARYPRRAGLPARRPL